MNGRSDRVLVFVYGTLMRGYSRHHHLRGQEFIAEASTQPLYRMVNCGSYPGLLRTDAGRAIEGELWAVDPVCLVRLDEVEGVSEGLYVREPVLLAAPYDRQMVQAYFYDRPADQFPDCGRRWT